MSEASSRCASIDSRPALTRASTNCNTASNLPTPMDHPFYHVHDAAKSLAPPLDSVRIRMPSQDRLGLPISRVDSVGTSEQFVPDEESRPVDSYFPPMRNPSTPVRNNSAKELISRYEAMTPSPRGTPARTSTASPLGSQHDSPLQDPAPSRPLSLLRDRSRSPLRDSFMNLMSLFGKKGRVRDDGSSFISSRYESSILSPPVSLTMASPRLHERNPMATIDKTPLRSGPVLYLARSSGDSTLPVWTNCKASLLEDRILLEWLTAYGNPSSSTIMLKKSTDVHSLAKSQVDPVEKSLLPLTGQDAYMFELTYPGGLPEKFATNSVAERSAWVSCVWDALLKLERTSEVEVSTIVGDAPEPQFKTDDDNSALESVHYDLLLPPRLSAGTSSASIPREYLSTASGASSTEAARLTLENIRMRTGRHSNQTLSDTTSLSAGIISEPSTPTKVMNRGNRVELLASSGSSPSIQNLGSSSIVRTRLSSLAASNANHNISPASTQPSRQSSVASNYSVSPAHAPSHLITPQSLRRDVSRTKSRASNAPLSRASSIDSKYEDEQSFYDFYAQPSFSGRVLSPVPDASESQVVDTLRMPTTSSTDVLSSTLPRRTNDKGKAPMMSNTQPTSAIDLRDERPLPDIPIILTQQASQKTISSYAAVSSDSKGHGETNDVHPLLSLIQDHAKQQCSQTTGIGHQIASLQRDVVMMSKDLRAVIAEQEPGTALRSALEDLCTKMERTAAANGVGLQELHQKIDSIAGQISAQGRTVADVPLLSLPNDSEAHAKRGVSLEQITTSVGEARDILKNDIPVIKEQLSSLQQAVAPPDVSQLNTKLDELLEVYRSLQPSQVKDEAPAEKPALGLRNVSPEHSTNDSSHDVNIGGKADKPSITTDVAIDDSKSPDSRSPDSTRPDSKPPDSKPPVAMLPDSKPPDSVLQGSKPPVTILPDSKRQHGVLPGSKPQVTILPDSKPPDSVLPDSKPPGNIIPDSTPQAESRIESKLSEVLSLLKSEEESKKLGANQQAENVRYLQELNTWLESFVNNGTTQIQSVALGVEKLCQELAPRQETVQNNESASRGGVRSDLLALAASVKAGEERDATLQALVTETLQTVQNKESEKSPLDMDAITQMIERQKQEQEVMLRGIATELSNDIRGERLRFVEAMKEATAINVQAHVEEFKKELGKEVMMMTCEVGRLQRERQTLEQQIADLFTFFAKQRAGMEQNQAEMARQSLQVPQAKPSRSNSKGRPLPVPKQ